MYVCVRKCMCTQARVCEREYLCMYVRVFVCVCMWVRTTALMLLKGTYLVVLTAS